jgi:23S rRNA (guanine2445-N2)-methyltransferase / 23S rRNA (guanine2069-N7)-methyltransferase
VLGVARRNAERAGLTGVVHFEQADARRLEGLPTGAEIVSNPPYGKRLGRGRLQLEGFFRQLGEAYRALATSPHMVLLSGMPGVLGHLGLQARRRHTIYNGPLRCELLEVGGGERKETRGGS